MRLLTCALLDLARVQERSGNDGGGGGSLTGVVVDSGDGCTHVIPVVDGFVISSSIRTVPLAGRDVSQHVQQLLRYAHPLISLQPARAAWGGCGSSQLCSLPLALALPSRPPPHLPRCLCCLPCRDRGVAASSSASAATADLTLDVARRIKEEHCYVCSGACQIGMRCWPPCPTV